MATLPGARWAAPLCRWGAACYRPACCFAHPGPGRVDTVNALAVYWCEKAQSVERELCAGQGVSAGRRPVHGRTLPDNNTQEEPVLQAGNTISPGVAAEKLDNIRVQIQDLESILSELQCPSSSGGLPKEGRPKSDSNVQGESILSRVTRQRQTGRTITLDSAVPDPDDVEAQDVGGLPLGQQSEDGRTTSDYDFLEELTLRPHRSPLRGMPSTVVALTSSPEAVATEWLDKNLPAKGDEVEPKQKKLEPKQEELEIEPSKTEVQDPEGFLFDQLCLLSHGKLADYVALGILTNKQLVDVLLAQRTQRRAS